MTIYTVINEHTCINHFRHSGSPKTHLFLNTFSLSHSSFCTIYLAFFVILWSSYVTELKFTYKSFIIFFKNHLFSEKIHYWRNTWTNHYDTSYMGVLGLLITNLLSDFQNSNWWNQYDIPFIKKMYYWRNFWLHLYNISYIGIFGVADYEFVVRL